MYFVDDEHYIERMKTIEQEKYLVQGDDVAGHPGGGFDARQAARYPSYASSNPYMGTLPDENYASRRGRTIQFFVWILLRDEQKRVMLRKK